MTPHLRLEIPGWRWLLSTAAGFLLVALAGTAVAAEEVAPEPRAEAPAAAPFGAPARAAQAAGPALPALAAPSSLGSIVATWSAQGPAPTTNAQVQNLSPNNSVDGAVHAIVPHPTNASILYVGAVNGGVWRTQNATAASPTWTSLTDFEPSLSIGALEMDPGDPMVLLAGIGRFSSFGGDPPFQIAGGDLNGLLRTTDGGTTWTPITDPLLVGEHISAVAARGSTLLAGANDFFGGGGGGLFRSTDTGASWARITGGVGTGLPFGTVDDLAGDPTSNGRLYVALQGRGVYRSDDTGATWTQVSNNDAPFNAAMLASSNTRIAVAGDARVFALVTNGSNVTYIGFSDDQGLTWTQMDVPGTVETALQGRDELMGLVADPSDSDIVYVSGISQQGTFPNSVGATSFHAHIFRGDVTRARGLTGNVSNQWDHLTHATGNALMPNGGTAGTSSPHADSREMAFDANGNLLEADDGGINRRTSPADNTGDWFAIDGTLQVTELHSVAYDTNFDVIVGGTQDTGAIEQTAPGSTTWNSVRLADGGKVAVDDATAGTSVRYLSSQRLSNFTRRTCNPGCSNAFPALSGGVPALVTGNGGNAQFYTPLELNAVDPTRLLLGALNDVYESMDQGNTVSAVPAAGGANVRANSDAAMVYGHPDNAELIVLGAGSQVFVRTTAGGNLAPTAAAFPGGTVFGVAVDPADEDVFYAIGASSVYQSTDGGASWTDITGNVADDGAGTFRAIEYMEDGATDKLVVGTNRGVRISVEGSFGTWFAVGTNLPNAPVWNLDYDATDDVLVAGTLGRGAWLLADASQINAPPVAVCQDVTVPADAMCLGFAQAADVDGGSFDPDGDPLTLAIVPAGPFALGDTQVTLTVTDDQGASDSCQATVTVVDVTPPTITQVDATPDTLWPPNHKFVPVSIAVTAIDNCDPDPVCQIVDVVSNEPVNGRGDGNTTPDWLVLGPLNVALRAERSGRGNGRIYTVSAACTDDAANQSPAVGTPVTVEHDQRK